MLLPLECNDRRHEDVGGRVLLREQRQQRVGLADKQAGSRGSDDPHNLELERQRAQLPSSSLAVVLVILHFRAEAMPNAFE